MSSDRSDEPEPGCSGLFFFDSVVVCCDVDSFLWVEEVMIVNLAVVDMTSLFTVCVTSLFTVCVTSLMAVLVFFLYSGGTYCSEMWRKQFEYCEFMTTEECLILNQSGPDWHQMGQIQDFSDQISKCTEI